MKPTAAGLHVKTRDRVKVLDATRTALAADGLEWAGGEDAPEDAVRLLLMPARGPWTTLYLEQFDLAPALAGRIALQVQAPVLAVGHHEEMAFFYLAYGPDGEEVDAYHSCPDYAKEMDEDDASEAELEATRGDPEILATLTGAKDAAALGALLNKARIERLRDYDSYGQSVDAGQALRDFAKLLGLPDLAEGFDDHWGIDEDDGADGVRYLAYAAPADPTRLERLYGRLRDRWLKRGEAKETAAEPADEEQSEA